MISIARLDFFLIFLIFIVTFFVSTAFGIAFFLIAVILKQKFSDAFFLYLIFIISLVSFTQYSTWNTTNYDMVGYYTVYNFLSSAPLSQAFYFVIKKGDIFFYFLVLVVSKIFPNEPRTLGFMMPFITSFLSFLTIKNFRNGTSGKGKIFKKVHIILWCLSFFLIISFPNYTNAYRQFLSISLFVFAISRKFIGRQYIIFFILSALSHWSSLILIAFYFVFLRLQNIDTKVLSLMPIFGIFSSYILILIPLPAQAKAYLFGNEILGIDKTLIVTGTLIQILLFRYYKDLKIKLNPAYVIAFLLLGYNFFFITNSTLLTRHFFLVSYFVVITLITFVDKRYFKNYLFIPIIFITVSINIKQISNGEFNYSFISKNMYLNSAFDIFSTQFPYEIIR